MKINYGTIGTQMLIRQINRWHARHIARVATMVVITSLLFIAAVMLSGCTTTPTKLPAVITEPVVVTRVVYVPIPGELTKPHPLYHIANQTCGEYAKGYTINTAAAQACNQDKADISAVQNSEK